MGILPPTNQCTATAIYAPHHIQYETCATNYYILPYDPEAAKIAQAKWQSFIAGGHRPFACRHRSRAFTRVNSFRPQHRSSIRHRQPVLNRHWKTAVRQLR